MSRFGSYNSYLNSRSCCRDIVGFIGPTGATGTMFTSVTNSNETFYPTFVRSTIGGQTGYFDTDLTYNPSTSLFNISQNISGGPTNPILKLENTHSDNGNSIGIPSIETYKSGRQAVAGDIIHSQHYYANQDNIKREFTKLEMKARNVGLVNNNGSISFYGLKNSTLTEFMQLNGPDNMNNMYLPLNMNDNTITTSSGNLIIDTTSSSDANASVVISTKNNVAGSGNGFALKGNTIISEIPSTTSSGKYLCLTINNVVYKINLLNF